MFNFLAFTSFLIFLGCLVSLFHSYTFFDRTRDFVHFLKPIVVVLMGYLLARKIDDTTFIFRTVVYVALFFAFQHFVILGITDFKEGTIEEIRLRGGAGNFIELLALILIVTFNKKGTIRLIKSPLLRFFVLFLLSSSIILYFSRTMLMGIVVFLLSVYGLTKLSRKMLEYSTLGLVVFGLFFAYLFTLNLDADKPGIQNFFYKIRNTPSEMFSTPAGYDPKNHKEIFNHWRGYEASMVLKQMQENSSNYIFGKGFGALVDLGFKAPIGGEDGLRFIPHFHNGYVYVFFKTGIIGLLFYLILLLNIYRQVYVKFDSEIEKKVKQLISGFGVYFLLTSFVITGIYNLGEISVFFLGTFFFIVQKESCSRQNIG